MPPEAGGQLFVMRCGHQFWTRRSPKKVASIDYLHSFRDEAGQVNHEIEAMFSKLEGLFSPVLAKVLRRETLDLEGQITFASNLMVLANRAPTAVEHFNGIWSQVADMSVRIANAHAEEPMDMEGATIHANPLATLMSMVEAGLDLGELLWRMEWRFLCTRTPHFFITSDHPFGLVDPTNTDPHHGVGMANPEVEASFPLSRTMAFFAGWHRPLPNQKEPFRAFLPVGPEMVEEINRRSTRLASREIIAPTRGFPGAEGVIAGWKRRGSRSEDEPTPIEALRKLFESKQPSG